MRFDSIRLRFDENHQPIGAMAFFKGEVVAVELNGIELNLDYRVRARNILAIEPTVKVRKSNGERVRYVSFIEAP